ncbi:MAG: site-specific DNA-methyltransferase [Proteobacteria bacterium]|nr:site-specific DNA-methyltransferase [Pseudomonadota bacterium]
MPPRNQRNNGPISVSSLKHDDKRVNIPTEELRDFVSDAEKAPQTMLYPRDPSLDPQLVWKGKDEQDRHPLAVPVVPIYIQEKIHPQAIVEAIRAEARKEVEPQADLFSDFNGITFENLIDFYAHEQNWSNRMILGDSLTVMTSLAEKEGLKGKVQMIYLDPPYGIKFGSNWQVSTRKREVKDGKAEDASREPEVVKAFRDTWELGIHSYLAYLRDRLVLARELLGETGSVFVQIGEENLHLVRCLLDEVMGSENFCSIISFRKTTTQAGDLLPDTNDYVLWYGRSRLQVKHRTPYLAREGSDWVNYDFVRLPSGEHRRMSSAELRDTCPVPDGGTIYRRSPLTSASASLSTSMDITYEGKTFSPGKGGWKTNRVGFSRLAAANRLESYGATLSYRRYITDFPYFPLSNSWIDTASGGYGDDKVYVVQTNAKVIARCMLMTTDPGDLVLDPTCGSGTTAYVAEQWGRRWITVDTSRVALALARTRLMAARYPYYYLADSAEGVKKGGEVTGIVPPEYRTTNDVRKGFVYRRVPHVTLKSIANNPDIDSIHDRWQAKLDPLLAKLNKAAGAKWLEWEVPRPDAPEAAKLAKMAKETLAQWWALRRDRQQEIDASIAHHADTETLFDQPYEDGKRVRVAGPFTVESLSPHRVLSTADGSPIAGLVHDDGSGTPSTAHLARKGPSPDYPGAAGDDAGSFVTMLIDNLRASGVKGTEKGLRIRFDRLDPYAGLWLQASGEYTDAEGKSKRVAVAFGPERGTVGPDLVKEAAKEAVQGVGFDLLLVCGFAFDPHVSEEAKRYGKLDVLVTRMNPDLAMGDELLKKTGAGNLFMVFGEPDIRIRDEAGQVVVEIRGVDVYDPTTGEIRSHSTDDIACWFIDTAYNGEAFFVRHAYFTGADEPYQRLKRALRADVDEAVWSALHSTTSRPFDPPSTGRIAVKVINHFGDEVLKTFDVTEGAARPRRAKR